MAGAWQEEPLGTLRRFPPDRLAGGVKNRRRRNIVPVSSLLRGDRESGMGRQRRPQACRWRGLSSALLHGDLPQVRRSRQRVAGRGKDYSVVTKSSRDDAPIAVVT
jgi:hypothetical protein